MQRRALLTTVSGLLVAGCTTETTEQSSPSSSSTASASRSPSPTPHHSTTQSEPDCPPKPDLSITNLTPRRLTVSITITAAGGRYRGEASPTQTRGSTPPSETPVQTYEGTVELEPYPDGENSKTYERVPRKTGWHRLEIDVEDGPERTFGFHPPYGDRMGYEVDIYEDKGISGGAAGWSC